LLADGDWEPTKTSSNEPLAALVILTLNRASTKQLLDHWLLFGFSIQWQHLRNGMEKLRQQDIKKCDFSYNETYELMVVRVFSQKQE
jgi:hypothetical protein